MNASIKTYADAVRTLHKTGSATEHTYRGALAALLDALLPHYHAVNEPKHTACGAPDYALVGRRDRIPHAYIEAKDLFDGDLLGLKPKQNKPQFDRYKAALARVAFTDYLTFHFFANGEKSASVALLEPDGKGGFTASDAAAAQFTAALTDWADCPMQPITTPSRLAEIMAEKARLLAAATRGVLASDTPGEVGGWFKSFRQMLIDDLAADDFADILAQTIAYGMFAARIFDTSPEDFSRQEAAALIPESNPFLRRLFQQIAANDLDPRIAWIIDDLADAFAATDIRKVLRGGNENVRNDPLIHFYENFLGAYDPALKKSCGVFYTPEPVVRFIVRAVDDVLKRDFGLTDGLADSSRIDDCHRVQILDPATGTGTFLAETVRVIKEKFAGNEGMWPGYAEEDLKPRLHGFELLMAPYTIAHLKLAMAMESKGKSRLSVYLTNSLEDGHRVPELPFAQWLSDEANGARRIKQDTPVMVMLGNPPYSVSSSNRSDWILNLIEDYKKGLNEKKLNLDDDYIKFIRLGQNYIDRNGSGILAFITNNSYLDGLTHRRMRQSLMESFDEIYIVNLHGNSKRKETAPDGGKDENVFDIMVGTSIAIFVKRGGKGNELARVHYVDLWGRRKAKFAALDALEISMEGRAPARPKNEDTDARERVPPTWQILAPRAPHYFFVPKDFSLEEEYNRGIKIDELFGEFGIGIKFRKDKILVQFTEKSVANMVDDINQLEDNEFLAKYNSKETPDWTVAEKRSLFVPNKPDAIKRVTYRPFDYRYCYYPVDLVSRIIVRGDSRINLMRHLLRDNLALLSLRQSRDGSINIFVGDGLVTKDTVSSLDSCTVFPLYRYEEIMGRVEKVSNLNLDVLRRMLMEGRAPARPHCLFSDAQERVPPNLEFFAYCYAVLHSPMYRERYKEFLKIDFPRIPLPKSAAGYRRLVALGQRLIDLHLMRVDFPNDALPNFPVIGSNIVEEVRWETGRVYINTTQYFDKVPESAFNFFIGGYQPAQKWLKDRKGRTLTNADLTHYRRLIATLTATAALMSEIG